MIVLYIFKSSASRRYLELWIELQISLINMLKSRGPKVEPWGTPDFTRQENERVPEIQTDESLLSR
jgi:hypothetical protein